MAKHRGWTVLQRGAAPVSYPTRKQARQAQTWLRDAWVEGPLSGAVWDLARRVLPQGEGS